METQELTDAKDLYAEARAALREAISNNQKAMATFRMSGTAANKAAYDATRKAHKVALQAVKDSRAEYYRLLTQS